MDYLVPVKGSVWGDHLNEYGKYALAVEEHKYFDLYDFKYSNNAKSYAVSGQLHEYKYWYELTHPGHRIRNMYFLIVPKVKIRQKKTETLQQFRGRLQDTLKDAEPSLMPVQYDPLKVVDFLTDTKHMVEATEFPKNPNHFCGWCEYAEKANSIFPSDVQRIELRKAHLLEARASLMALDVRLTHVYLILNQNPEGAFTTSKGVAVKSNDAIEKLDKMAQNLGELIDKENELLKGAIKNVSAKMKS